MAKQDPSKNVRKQMIEKLGSAIEPLPRTLVQRLFNLENRYSSESEQKIKDAITVHTVTSKKPDLTPTKKTKEETVPATKVEIATEIIRLKITPQETSQMIPAMTRLAGLPYSYNDFDILKMLELNAKDKISPAQLQALQKPGISPAEEDRLLGNLLETVQPKETAELTEKERYKLFSKLAHFSPSYSDSPSYMRDKLDPSVIEDRYNALFEKLPQPESIRKASTITLVEDELGNSTSTDDDDLKIEDYSFFERAKPAEREPRPLPPPPSNAEVLAPIYASPYDVLNTILPTSSSQNHEYSQLNPRRETPPVKPSYEEAVLHNTKDDLYALLDSQSNSTDIKNIDFPKEGEHVFISDKIPPLKRSPSGLNWKKSKKEPEGNINSSTTPPAKPPLPATDEQPMLDKKGGLYEMPASQLNTTGITDVNLPQEGKELIISDKKPEITRSDSVKWKKDPSYRRTNNENENLSTASSPESLIPLVYDLATPNQEPTNYLEAIKDRSYTLNHVPLKEAQQTPVAGQNRGHAFLQSLANDKTLPSSALSQVGVEKIQVAEPEIESQAGRIEAQRRRSVGSPGFELNF